MVVSFFLYAALQVSYAQLFSWVLPFLYPSFDLYLRLYLCYCFNYFRYCLDLFLFLFFFVSSLPAPE